MWAIPVVLIVSFVCWYVLIQGIIFMIFVIALVITGVVRSLRQPSLSFGDSIVSLSSCPTNVVNLFKVGARGGRIFHIGHPKRGHILSTYNSAIQEIEEVVAISQAHSLGHNIASATIESIVQQI